MLAPADVRRLAVRRDGDRVLGTPHPDVDSLRTAISVESRRARVGREPVRLGPISTHSDVVLSGGLSPGSDLYVAVLQQDMPVLAVAVSHDTAALHRPGSRAESLPVGAGPELTQGSASHRNPRAARRSRPCATSTGSLPRTGSIALTS